MSVRSVVAVEARMTSSRLPGKVLLPAAGKPLLELMIERLTRIPNVDDIVVATTLNRQDDPIEALARRSSVGCFRGSEDDVLGRVLGAAQTFAADVIVETMADCPAIDPAVVAQCLQRYLDGGVDFVSNTLEPTYPWGMDTRVFATSALAEIARITTDAADREHVSLYFWEHPDRYRICNVAAPEHLRWPELHVELDTEEDYQQIKALFEALYPDNPEFGLVDIIQFFRSHPDIARLNANVVRRTAR